MNNKKNSQSTYKFHNHNLLWYTPKLTVCVDFQIYKCCLFGFQNINLKRFVPLFDLFLYPVNGDDEAVVKDLESTAGKLSSLFKRWLRFTVKEWESVWGSFTGSKPMIYITRFRHTECIAPNRTIGVLVSETRYTTICQFSIKLLVSHCSHSILIETWFVHFPEKGDREEGVNRVGWWTNH